MSWFKRTTSKLYYRLFAFMSGVAIEPGSADFCLLDRQVVDEVLKFEEEGLFLRGLVHWVGYATASVPFECGERHAGTSKYSLRKMLTLGWHGVSSFSLVPLRIGIAIGLLSSTFAFLGTAYAIVGWWVDDAVVPGWASSVAISSFLFGVLFAFLAVLAEYVGRIAVEVRRRPRFLVRETTRPVLVAADRRAQRRGGGRSRGRLSATRAGFRSAASVCALRRRRLCELRRELCGVLCVVSVSCRSARSSGRGAVANVLAYCAGLANSFVLEQALDVSRRRRTSPCTH